MLKRRNVIQNTAIRKGITYNEEIVELMNVMHPPRVVPQEPVEPPPPVDPLEGLNDITKSIVKSSQALVNPIVTSATLATFLAKPPISAQAIGILATRVGNVGDDLIAAGDDGQEDAITQLIPFLDNLIEDIKSMSEVNSGNLADQADSDPESVTTAQSALAMSVNQLISSAESFLSLAKDQDLPESSKSISVFVEILIQSVIFLRISSGRAISDRHDSLLDDLKLAISAQELSIVED